MDRELKPLTTIGLLIALVLIRFKKGNRKEALQRRIDYTRKLSARRQAARRMRKQILWECNHFWKMAQNSFVQRGEAHISRGPDLGNQGKRVRRPKVHKIQLERGFYREEMIWCKIQVNKRQLWTTKNTLPYGVELQTALSRESLFELSFALNRVCTAKLDDPRTGAYLIIHRLEGFDGLPIYLAYKDCIEHFPVDLLPKAPIMVGYEEHKKFRTITLAQYPHILIAGTSGSGKSTFLNQVLCSWFRFADPALLKLVLIDLKKMEFGHYASMPHLLEPTITDAENTVRILQYAVDQVLIRAGLFQDKAKELAEWNRRHPKKQLPRIVIVIDEFAELMLGTPTEVKNAILILIQRLVNLGRAVGIHLIIATQRPAVEVLPNKIKINMGWVLCGRVPSASQSITIIGTGAAAKLPVVAGRMVYLAGSDIHQTQTPHIIDEDIESCLAIARGKSEGIITLLNGDPIIESEGLLIYVVDCLQGELKPETLVRRLKPLGVPPRALRSWLLQVLGNRDAPFEVRGRIFNVVKGDDFYRIVETLPAWDFHFDGAIPALAPPRPLLLLASGLPIETQGAGSSEMETRSSQGIESPLQLDDSETQTTRNTGDSPLLWSKERLFDQFLAECCEVGHGRYRMSKQELRDYFRSWCNRTHPDIPPISDIGVAKLAKQKGFIQGLEKYRGVLHIRVWKRVKIKPEYDQVLDIQSDQDNESIA